MRWNQVDKSFNLESLKGKVVTNIESEYEGDTCKSLLLELDGSPLCVKFSWETLKLMTPQKTYRITGKIPVGNLFATIDPIDKATEDEAKAALEDLLLEHPAFEGGIEIINA